MKTVVMLSLLLGVRAAWADVSPSKTYWQFHSDSYACVGDQRGSIFRSAAAYANLYVHLNGEIAEQAELGHELTGIRRNKNGECIYAYTRKVPEGKSAKVAFSRNENYFDVQALPCDTDSDYNAGRVNDVMQSEADHNFHYVSTLDTEDDQQCYYIFVRNLVIK